MEKRDWRITDISLLIKGIDRGDALVFYIACETKTAPLFRKLKT